MLRKHVHSVVHTRAQLLVLMQFTHAYLDSCFHHKPYSVRKVHAMAQTHWPYFSTTHSRGFAELWHHCKKAFETSAANPWEVCMPGEDWGCQEEGVWEMNPATKSWCSSAAAATACVYDPAHTHTHIEAGQPAGKSSV